MERMRENGKNEEREREWKTVDQRIEEMRGNGKQRKE